MTTRARLRTSDNLINKQAALNATIQKITPMLWFDQQAEEAATFYVSVFKNGFGTTADD